jgi:hypothetical protein
MRGPRDELHAWLLTKLLGQPVSVADLKRNVRLAAVVQSSSFIHPVSGAIVRFTLPDESAAAAEQYSMG